MKKLTLISLVLGLCACGANGTNGIDGQPGPQGNPGVDGSCTVSSVAVNSVAPNGGSLIQCSDGTSSLVLNGTNGSNGVNGTNGTNGTNGINGTNGTNGTVISSIQFCPGTPSYPSVFPEVGFLINGTIYAVYSANDGFLTALTPGTYSSNAIGNSCTFTVNANGTISH